jgi:two-component system chemotaxis response regulator CheY
VVNDVRRATATRCVALVVDDEPDVRYLLRSALEGAGYAVVEASHGEAALEQVRRSPPQIVLTDRMMPRMDGIELIGRLRAEESTKAIPIVLVSGTRGSLAGADAVLWKPFDVNELVALVDKLTGKES